MTITALTIISLMLGLLVLLMIPLVLYLHRSLRQAQLRLIKSLDEQSSMIEEKQQYLKIIDLFVANQQDWMKLIEFVPPGEGNLQINLILQRLESISRTYDQIANSKTDSHDNRTENP